MGSSTPARLNASKGIGRVQGGVHNFDAVHPMLHMISLDQNSGLIELSHRTRGHARRGNHVVQRTGRMLEVALGISVLCVVSDLIFEADHVILTPLRALGNRMQERALHALLEPFMRRARFLWRDEPVILNAILDAAVPSA